MIARSFACLLLSSVIACNLDLPNGGLRCAANGACPSGMSCSFDDHCWKAGSAPPSNLALGESCDFDQSCASGTCADSVCCNEACADLCVSCASDTARGTCTPISVGSPSPPSHPQCTEPETCDGSGSCALKPVGVACGVGAECQTNNCFDDVCCTSSSCSLCAACDVAGHLGTCTLAAPGTDPHHDCSSVDGDAACNSSCDGSGNCAPITAPSCASSTCADTSADSSPAMLAGEGLLTTFSCMSHKCVANTAFECGAPFVCAADGTQCVTDSCTSDFDCSSGTFCGPTNFCNASSSPGAETACTRDVECGSGYCGPGGTCLDCVTDAECDIAHGNPLCTAGICEQTTDCTQVDCEGQGLGDGCQVVNTFAQCTTTSAAACLDPSRPNFDDTVCVCAVTFDGEATSCGHGEVCSTAAGVTGAHCVGVAGRPCWGNPACASGVCTNHVCETAGAGVLCRTGVECTSGTCSVTAASNSRTVCN